MNNQNYLFLNSANLNNTSLNGSSQNFYYSTTSPFDLLLSTQIYNNKSDHNKFDNNMTKSNDYESLFKITQQITGLYLMPLVSIFGILGNILIVLVYTKTKLSSTNIYLIALSMSDILKLANDFLYFVVTLINKFDANLGDNLFTSLYLYSHFVFLFTAINTSWLTTAIAMDRYVSVVRNKNVSKNQQKGYLKTIIINILIFILSSIISLPSPLFLKYDSFTQIPQSNITSQLIIIFTNPNYKKSYNIFNSTIKAYIPLVLTIILDYQIISFVYKNKMKKKNHDVNKKKRSAKKSVDKKSRVSAMLITIVTVFAICMVPDSILTMMNLGYANESYLVRSIREITDFLLAINSASTFPICLYFSIQFRVKLKEILMFDKFCFELKTNNSPRSGLYNNRNDNKIVKKANADNEDEEDDIERVSSLMPTVVNQCLIKKEIY